MRKFRHRRVAITALAVALLPGLVWAGGRERAEGAEVRRERAPSAAPTGTREPYLLFLSAPSVLSLAHARNEAREQAWRAREAARIAAGAVLDPPVRAPFSMASLPVQADLAAWRQARDRLQRSIRDRLGRPVSFGIEAAVAGSVVSAGLTASEAARLDGVPGLAGVAKVRYFTPSDAAAARLVQSPRTSTGPTVWDGSAFGFGAQGEGMVVAVLDSGIRPGHNAFATTHDDGYVQPAPRRGNLGLCANDPTLGCNAKVIGIYDYTGRGLDSDGSQPPIPSATKGIDQRGHGTGMAAHAAGSRVQGTSPVGPGLFSGVAPRARVLSYQVCVTGSCRMDWVAAALDQAIRDGAHVVNMSFGGGDRPLQMPVDASFFDARDAGMVIVSASGNSGPAPGAEGPCTGVTVLCAGNSSTDRLPNSLLIDAGQADRLHPTSTPGPGTSSIGLVKPDVTTPGSNVWSPAYTTATGYDFYTNGGTSTATALASGSALLLRQLRTSWGGAALVSALSTGARPSIVLQSGQPATPFEAGAGRVQVENAARQGLYFPDIVGPIGELLPYRPICVDGERFYPPTPRSFACLQGGPIDPVEYWTDQNLDGVNDIEGGVRRVNRASVSHEACSGSCSVQRLVQGLPGTGRITWRVRAQTPDGIEVSVSPNQFTLTPATQQLLTIRFRGYANGSGNVDPGWAFGRLWLEPVESVDAAGRPGDGSRVTAAQVPWAVNFTNRETAPTRTPVSLPWGVLTSVTLPAGEAHERMWFDVPAGLLQARISVSVSGPGDIDLYVADAVTDASGVAPPRSAARYRAEGPGGIKEIVIDPSRLKYGRLWITPVNRGSSSATLQVTVQPSYRTF